MLILLVTAIGLSGKALPWETIAKGNSYWADMLGVAPADPSKASPQQIIKSGDVQPDASLRLINAALRYQINQLPNNDMVRFGDSLMHVMIYLSGGSPMAPDAFDRAGWWRLSYPVALRYGLRVDKNIDERLDFELATKAAMRYARDLQRQFSHKPHAWLEAFVESPLEVTRPNGLHSLDTLQRSLFALYKVMVISDYTTAEQYAVQHFYGNVKEWRSRELMLTDLVIERTGMPEPVFFALNPDLRSGVIPAKKSIKLTGLAAENLKKSEEDVILLSKARLEEDASKLAHAKAKVKKNEPDPRKVATTTYRVRSGDNLGRIAERFGVGVSDLKSWNNLRSDLIYAGQKLIVYGSDRKPQTTSPAATNENPATKPPALKQGEFISYKVKNGDTLWSIAKRFPGVSPDNIMTWNGISSSIKVGQEIKILKSEIRDYDPNRYPDVL